MDIFPSGAGVDLLDPHFIDDAALPMLRAALEQSTDAEVADLHRRFVQARQAAMIDKIRRVCGVAATPADTAQEDEPEEAAADVQDGTAPSYDTDDDLLPTR